MGCCHARDESAKVALGLGTPRSNGEHDSLNVTAGLDFEESGKKSARRRGSEDNVAVTFD